MKVTRGMKRSFRESVRWALYSKAKARWNPKDSKSFVDGYLSGLQDAMRLKKTLGWIAVCQDDGLWFTRWNRIVSKSCLRTNLKGFVGYRMARVVVDR